MPPFDGGVRIEAESFRDAQAASSFDANVVEGGAPLESLDVCRSYFVDGNEARIIVGNVAQSFWPETEALCRTRGFVEDRTVCEFIDFTNHLLDWTLLLFGCEPQLVVPPELNEFGKGTFVESLELSQADVDNLVDHYMTNLTSWVALDDEDAAQVRSAVSAAFGSRRAPGDAAPRLDRCGVADSGVGEAASNARHDAGALDSGLDGRSDDGSDCWILQ